MGDSATSYGMMPPRRITSWFVAKIDRVIAPHRIMAGGDELRRLRLIVSLMVLAIVFSPVMTINLLMTGQVFEALVLVGMWLGALILLVAVRKGARSSVVGHGLGVAMLTPVVVTGGSVGGVFGPAALSLPGLPVLMTLVMGGRQGWPWCGLSVLTSILLGFQSQGELSEIRINTLALINGTIILTVVAYVFEVLRRQAVEAMAEARDEAAAAAAAKSRFLANMSHEIRTPMNGVLGMLGILIDSELRDDQHECATTAYASGTALLDILNDVLDFSKASAGQLTLSPGVLDLRALVEGVTEQAAVLAEAKGLELVVRYMPGTPTQVRGDSGRLRQIILNLVGNAIKFTERGYICVSVRQADEPAGALELSVEDTGIGIPQSQHAAIFEQFQQLDMSASRVHPGTGLGLAIVRELVELMGGTLGLESEPGRGATFRVTVALPSVEPAPPRSALFVGLRALVVDDVEISRTALVERLADQGLEVEARSTAQGALERLREAAGTSARFSVVLVDHALGDDDGLALGRAIGGEPELREMVLVLLGSIGKRVAPKALQEAGFAALVTKPVRQRALVETLASARTHQAEPRPTSTSPRQHDVVPRGLRVLLVEDNVVNQKVATRMLARLGCEVGAVGDGQQAIDAFAGGSYDIVFMDVQMPRVDGLTATAKIREHEVDGARVPIVAMTAHAMAEDRQRCLDAGMDEYISKPIQRGELARVLSALVPASPAQPALGCTTTSPATG